MATKIVGKKNKETVFKEDAQANPAAAAKKGDIVILSEAVEELRAEIVKLKAGK